MDVFVSGIGMTRFGKSKDSLESMMAEAAALALKDADLESVDAIYIGVMNVEEFVGDSNFAALLADTLDLTGVPSTRVETASSTGAGVFEAAFYAVASGHLKHVLVLAGEKMTHLPTAKTTRILSEVIDRSERRYGATMPALAAMVAQKYGQEYKLSPETVGRDLLLKWLSRIITMVLSTPTPSSGRRLQETTTSEARWFLIRSDSTIALPSRMGLLPLS